MHFVSEKNIEGIKYEKLLRLALKQCDKFRVSILISLDYENTFFEKLKPYIISECKEFVINGDFEDDREHDKNISRKLWQNTSYVYEFSQDTLPIILELSNSLYDWRDPKLPENFTLFREEDNVAWLESIEHEKLNIWNVSKETKDILVNEMIEENDFYED